MKKAPLQLPNGCRVSYPKVHPVDWEKVTASTKKDWYIHYRFYDPLLENKFKYGYLVIVKQMNSEKAVLKRRESTKKILADLITDLKEGFNPYTGKTDHPASFAFELSSSTPFIKALWKAADKLNYVSITDVKCVIRGVEAAAKELNLDHVPVSQITRKYITVILEKCGKLNKRWSARRYNVYRTALIALFKHLIQMEAVDINPVKDVVKMVETKKIRLTLTPEERALINQRLYKNYYPFWRAIHIFFNSLSRETELFNVQGKHVDFKTNNCRYTVRKGPSVREVDWPIIDEIVPLWKELMKTCGPEDYLFSEGLVPGPVHIEPRQFGMRWKRHIKDKPFILKDKTQLRIKADLYSLKHSFATALMDTKDGNNDKEKIVAEALAHKGTKMLAEVYDINSKERKDDFIRKSNIKF